MTPNQILDLSHFSLTGPKDASRIYRPYELTNGFSDPDFFFVKDKVVHFRAWAGGSATANATNPRSELREQLLPGNNDVNWPLDGIHSLEASCAVLECPSDDDVFVAQIHTKLTNKAVVKLRWVGPKKKLVLDVKRGPNGGDIHQDIVSMKKGVAFTYKVLVADGQVRVWIDGKPYKIFSLTEMGWKNNAADNYFKAGCYYKNRSSNGVAVVAFTKLKVTHS